MKGGKSDLMDSRNELLDLQSELGFGLGGLRGHHYIKFKRYGIGVTFHFLVVTCVGTRVRHYYTITDEIGIWSCLCLYFFLRRLLGDACRSKSTKKRKREDDYAEFGINIQTGACQPEYFCCFEIPPSALDILQEQFSHYFLKTHFGRRTEGVFEFQASDDESSEESEEDDPYDGYMLYLPVHPRNILGVLRRDDLYFKKYQAFMTWYIFKRNCEETYFMGLSLPYDEEWPYDEEGSEILSYTNTSLMEKLVLEFSPSWFRSITELLNVLVDTAMWKQACSDKRVGLLRQAYCDFDREARSLIDYSIVCSSMEFDLMNGKEPVNIRNYIYDIFYHGEIEEHPSSSALETPTEWFLLHAPSWSESLSKKMRVLESKSVWKHSSETSKRNIIHAELYTFKQTWQALATQHIKKLHMKIIDQDKHTYLNQKLIDKIRVLNLKSLKYKDEKEKLEDSKAKLENENDTLKFENDRLISETLYLTEDNRSLTVANSQLRDEVALSGSRTEHRTLVECAAILNQGTKVNLSSLSGEILRSLHCDTIECLHNIQLEIAKRDLRIETCCSVCMDAPRNTVFIPCGHMFCSYCSMTMETCPICRKTKTSTNPIYDC